MKKGIILAGGSGTRLYPITKAVSKQLLPVYDKPMIYYPLSVLMMADIRKVLVITTPEDQEQFKRLLGDGSWLGMEIEYAVQEKPNGLAQAFVIGRDFIGDDDVCLVLGDNIFFGHDLGSLLDKRDIYENKATVFGYYVSDPSRYGVVEFDDDGHVVSIEEKPKKPKSNYAVVGLYFYPNDVVEVASRIKPSKRGEYEITDLNREYLKQNRLDVRLMGRGFAWLDTGTHNSLSDATNFVRTLVDRTGLQIGCVEEIAYDKGWISSSQLKKLTENYGNSSYGAYLRTILSKCICTTTTEVQ